ncbi:hypothetical protein HYALB_00000453 [Hymenoscyphus albidus]|uniref:Uncharacterized protein n=1 Tax=Hymenoscyphus albidus TaxID=595503 RepID=A0A9N9LJG1_9HELO|nr:hypothetical protein HYALB_00000453 [Hymenoscyphus albidus]
MYTSRADSITEQNPMYGPKNGLACPEAEDWFEKRQQVRKQISQCKLDDQDWDYVKRFSDENVDGWAFYPGFCLLAQEPLDIYSTASRRPNQKFLLVNEVVFPSTEESASNRWTVETGSWHVYQHALNAAIEYMTAAHRSHKPIMLCLQRDLAEVYHELRQYEKDGLLYRAVLETQKKHDFFGPENPDTVLTMTKLVEHYARGYGSAEDREAGKVMSHELYDINKKILRQDNPKTERSWDLVAQLDHKEVALKACGDYIESRKERKAKRTSKDILWLIILRLKLIGHVCVRFELSSRHTCFKTLTQTVYS